MEGGEAGARPGAPGAGGATARRRSSIAAAAAAAAAVYGDAEPAVAAPSELRGDILDSVLRRAASDVLTVIPAQRSVVYTYDRVSNLLSVHVTATKDENVSAIDQTASHKAEPAASEEPVMFPPTMGMTGACFLQKRCLRMKEPHRHRAFHREYDVPKGMQVDSIICTPLIIRHRAIAVIQLLNRLNPDSTETQDESNESEASAKTREGVGDDFHDIKLHRMQSIRPNVKMGFSAKDEQKLIQFASHHLAYTVEMRLKRVDDNSVTHARIRELQASNAIDLLNILNARLERRSSEGEAAVPIAGAEFLRLPHQLRPPAQAPLVPIELVDTLIAINRLQARFRARRIRRSEKFAEALETFRKQHERVRSVVTLQRVARGCLIRKRVKKQRHAVAVLTRVYDHYRFRLKFEMYRHAKRMAHRKRIVVGIGAPLPPPVSSSNSFKRRSVVVRESGPVNKTLASATAIQRHFRGHQTRKVIKQMTGFTNLGKGLRNIVKLQSFVRGSLARIQFRRTKEMLQLRSMQTPPTVCLRIGMAPSSLDTSAKAALKGVEEVRSASSCCVYQLPERRSNAHVVRHRSLAPRHRLEALFDQARADALWHKPPPPTRFNTRPASIDAMRNKDGLEPASRRLVAANEPSVELIRRKPDEMRSVSALTSRGSLATLSRAFPSLVWEVTRQKGTLRPPAVEYAADRSVSGIHPSYCCCHRRRRQSAGGGSSNNDSRGSLTASSGSATVENGGAGASPQPSRCRCRCCRSMISNENQSGSILEHCDEFRREAFATVVKHHSKFPELTGSVARTPSKPRPSNRQAESPLLCCFLPTQLKMGAAFQRAERRLKSRVASISGDSADPMALTAPLSVSEAFAVPSPPRLEDERPV